MGRVCTICASPSRTAIDGAIVAGAAYPAITALYRVSEDALCRHKASHLPELLVKAEAARAVASADALLAEANRLYTVATAVMDEARAGGDPELALKAIGQAGRVLSLLGELLGEINRQPVTIITSPEWIAARGVLLAALGPYPEARVAVAGALVQIGEGTANGHSTVRRG